MVVCTFQLRSLSCFFTISAEIWSLHSKITWTVSSISLDGKSCCWPQTFKSTKLLMVELARCLGYFKHENTVFRRSHLLEKCDQDKDKQWVRSSLIYSFQCDLCDVGYVGYTCGHSHNRVKRHNKQNAFHKSFKAKSQCAIRLHLCESIFTIFTPLLILCAKKSLFTLFDIIFPWWWSHDYSEMSDFTFFILCFCRFVLKYIVTPLNKRAH